MTPTEPPRRIAILVFADVEELDFVGPLEVFAVAGRKSPTDRDQPLLDVFTVAASDSPVRCRNGLTVVPRYDFSEAPPAEILLVPGGIGTRVALHDEPTIRWVRNRATSAELVLSVCTGALILGRAGLLDGLRATTHHAAVGILGHMAPDAQLCHGQRLVDNGRLITAAGVAAGIDLALYVTARLFGPEHARRVASHIEYPYPEDLPVPDHGGTGSV